MAAQFSRLFWGLLLVMLDFSINGFDLLADGIGYLIVAAGCRQLANWSPRFGLARMLCFVLAALWLIGFLIDENNAVLFGLAVTITNCTMIWQLLGGVAEYARFHDRLDLAQRASSRRLMYISIALSASLLALVVRGNSGGALVFVLVLAAMIMMVMILHLLHRVKNEVAASTIFS